MSFLSLGGHFLREKYRVQKELSDKAGHDLARSVANSHLKMKEIEAMYGVKFKCAKAASVPQKPITHAPSLNPASG